MCKTCVHAVQTMVKSLLAVHILCADFVGTMRAWVYNRYLYQFSAQSRTPYLSTVFWAQINLLSAVLYPLSTVPIIRAIKE